MPQAIDYAEIQKRASKLYDRWKEYSGSERSGYQEFQKDLMGCFGIKIDPGTFYERHIGTGFADGLLDGICIIEMKAPNKYKTKEELEKILPQAKKYWKAEKKNVNFLVLSNFHSFLIVDTRDWSSQYIKLGELQNKINAFSFLIESSLFSPLYLHSNFSGYFVTYFFLL